MNVAKIVYLDEANGEGLRTSLFVSGCRRHCKGCFNDIAWDFNYGVPYDETIENYILESINNPEVDGISLLGGEPLESENQYALTPLLIEAKKLGKSVWLYSGYTFEEITSEDFECLTPLTYMFLGLCDVLVDGPYIQDKRNLMLKFRGSSNQRILDIKKSLDQHTPIYYKDYNETI